MKQLYGSTETACSSASIPTARSSPTPSARRCPGSSCGSPTRARCLIRSPGAVQGVLQEPGGDRRGQDADGWVHTGDAGYLDERGHLRIIDRAKDVGKLDDGTLFAPKYLENKLKFFPHINEAVAFGAWPRLGRARSSTSTWTRSATGPSGATSPMRAIPISPQQRRGVRARAGCIERVERRPRARAELAGSQIHRFLILHKELDADDGELTRTRKVRRGFIGEKYGVPGRGAVQRSGKRSTSRRRSRTRTAAPALFCRRPARSAMRRPLRRAARLKSDAPAPA